MRDQYVSSNEKLVVVVFMHIINFEKSVKITSNQIALQKFQVNIIMPLGNESFVSYKRPWLLVVKITPFAKLLLFFSNFYLFGHISEHWIMAVPLQLHFRLRVEFDEVA